MREPEERDLREAREWASKTVMELDRLLEEGGSKLRLGTIDGYSFEDEMSRLLARARLEGMAAGAEKCAAGCKEQMVVGYHPRLMAETAARRARDNAAGICLQFAARFRREAQEIGGGE